HAGEPNSCGPKRAPTAIVTAAGDPTRTNWCSNDHAPLERNFCTRSQSAEVLALRESIRRTRHWSRPAENLLDRQVTLSTHRDDARTARSLPLQAPSPFRR